MIISLIVSFICNYHLNEFESINLTCNQCVTVDMTISG